MYRIFSSLLGHLPFLVQFLPIDQNILWICRNPKIRPTSQAQIQMPGDVLEAKAEEYGLKVDSKVDIISLSWALRICKRTGIRTNRVFYRIGRNSTSTMMTKPSSNMTHDGTRYCRNLLVWWIWRTLALIWGSILESRKSQHCLAVSASLHLYTSVCACVCVCVCVFVFVSVYVCLFER